MINEEAQKQSVPYYPLISCIMPTAGRAAYVAQSVGYFPSSP